MSEDIFRQFWWLIFPLSWFVFGAWQSWLSYRANREALDLIKTYAAAGREPPPELLARIDKRFNFDENDDGFEGRRRRRYRGRERGWYQAVLFGIMGLGFGYAAVSDMYGEGQAFTIVAFVMAALSAASLVHVLFDRNRPGL